MSAVSYTHLDVYKRQIVQGTLFNLSGTHMYYCKLVLYNTVFSRVKLYCNVVKCILYFIIKNKMNQYFADNEPVRLRGNKSVVGYGVMEGRLLVFLIECSRVCLLYTSRCV